MPKQYTESLNRDSLGRWTPATFDPNLNEWMMLVGECVKVGGIWVPKTAKLADFDTGAGTDSVELMGLALPKAGGAVAGGTDADPIATKLTGSTIPDNQPVPTRSQGSKYQDLGLVLDNNNVAAGATVYSSYIDNVEWVRNAVVFTVANQQYDFVVARKNTEGAEDWASTIFTGQTSHAAYRPVVLVSSSSLNASAVFGKSVKFGIRNTSASTMTNAKIKIQLMGL